MRCVDEYHQFYEQARLWEHSYWFGIPMWKLPFDAMVIQELIYQIRPEYIIETGTGHGGSALFYAGICELLGEGKVITVDIDKKFEPEHVSQHNWADRITFLHGSSTNEIIFRDIEYLCKGKRNLVILDSWHSYDHVCKELELYEELVPVGSYLIV